MNKSQFGDCCQDLKDAMTVQGKSLFHVETNGVLFMALAIYKQTAVLVGMRERSFSVRFAVQKFRTEKI